MTKLHELQKLGQAVWLDQLDRHMISSGALKDWVAKGVTGMTSNPTIFHKALKLGDYYDEQIAALTDEQHSNIGTEALYEALLIQDIQDAADVLRPVYEETEGRDGFVSLEVSPDIANDTHATMDAVRRFKDEVNRPNAMFKIPATEAGIPAIEQLLGEGININITLMFSMKDYEAVARAYIKGLNQYDMDGGDISKVASVASFFISRIDVKLDEWFEQLGAQALKGKIGIANAKMVYQRFMEILSSDAWKALVNKGARPQRVLWASTSVKSPDYPETLYVDNLIGGQTINTMPIETAEAFMQKGTVDTQTILDDVYLARQALDHLHDLNVDLDEVANQLQREGVGKFYDSYNALLGLLEKKRQSVHQRLA